MNLSKCDHIVNYCNCAKYYGRKYHPCICCNLHHIKTNNISPFCVTCHHLLTPLQIEILRIRNNI